MKSDELAFARALLARRPNFWLYRTSQRAFAGDFVVVDLSSPKKGRRNLFAVELKRGERVRRVGTSSVQLRNTHAVVAGLVADGVVAEGIETLAVRGDAREMVDWFTPRRRRRAPGP